MDFVSQATIPSLLRAWCSSFVSCVEYSSLSGENSTHLDAVAGSGLADGRRQAVAHRPLGQEQPPGDVGNGRAVTGGAEDVALAGGQGGWGPHAAPLRR